MAELKLQHIYKAYQKDTFAVKNFNLDIKNKEFIVLVGPSGCGKSTILRLIAGLEKLTKGNIFMDGKLMNDLPPKERDMAFVFQNYALYPHMNVYQNMAFGLKNRKFPKTEIERRIKNTAQILAIEEYLDRKPKDLSGGQQQRVALGRAIVRDAKVFLMDEPLSNLDAKLRTHMRTEITKLHQRLQTTTIYVTHDQTEAMTMATRLVVMNEGEIQQIGTPEEVYENPANVFVGSFIGSPAMNFFTGELLDGQIRLGQVCVSIPEVKMRHLRKQGYVNKKIIMGIRPEDIHEASSVHPEDNIFHVKIESVELLGAENMIHSQTAGQPFSARLDRWSDFKTGQFCKLAPDMNRAHFFDYDTKRRIPMNK